MKKFIFILVLLFITNKLFCQTISVYNYTSCTFLSSAESGGYYDLPPTPISSLPIIITLSAPANSIKILHESSLSIMPGGDQVNVGNGFPFGISTLVSPCMTTTFTCQWILMGTDAVVYIY